MLIVITWPEKFETGLLPYSLDWLKALLTPRHTKHGSSFHPLNNSLPSTFLYSLPIHESVKNVSGKTKLSQKWLPNESFLVQSLLPTISKPV